MLAECGTRLFLDMTRRYPCSELVCLRELDAQLNIIPGIVTLATITESRAVHTGRLVTALIVCDSDIAIGVSTQNKQNRFVNQYHEMLDHRLRTRDRNSASRDSNSSTRTSDPTSVTLLLGGDVKTKLGTTTTATNAVITNIVTPTTPEIIGVRYLLRIERSGGGISVAVVLTLMSILTLIGFVAVTLAKTRS